MNTQNMAAAKIERVNKIKIYKADDNSSRGWHFHDEYEMIYIQNGSASFTINGKETIFEKNTIVFIGNLDKHMMTPIKEPYARYVTIIDSAFFEQLVTEPVLCSIFKRCTKQFSNGISLEKEDSNFVMQNLEQSLADYNMADSFYEYYCMTFVIKILIHLFRHNRTHFPDYVNKRKSQAIAPIQKFLDENYTRNISLDKLSSAFFINKYHLSRMFRETTGHSIKRYITLKRIRKAKELLYYTESDISHIAAECGYNSTSNFIRAFIDSEEITPLCFRKKHNRNQNSE